MKVWFSLLLALAAALLALAGGGASGAAVDPAGCLANDLGRGDDISSAAVALPFPVDFFGTTYGSLYVNSNGNVTFDAPLADYTPAGMPNLHVPLIAPFFADVDTRHPSSGTVHWGETTVGSAKSFCVLWDGVGYYNTHATKLNRFQLLLVDRPDQAAGDFDIVLNYDQMQWETGDADSGVDGLGGLAAEVGFTNADQHFSMFGSQQSGAFLDTNPAGLVYGSFNGGDVPGRYVFRIRSGNPGLGQPVSGRVRAASDGTIVPDTLLQLCPVGGSGEACLTTNTRSDGSYTFVDVTDGTWNLVAFPPERALLQGGSLSGIHVAGAAVTGVDLMLQDGPATPPVPNGSVQTPGGDPIADATVTVLAAPTPLGPFEAVPDASTVLAPGLRTNPTVTDATGTFAVDALAGFYKVRAAKAGCAAAGDPTVSYAESPLLTLPPAPIDLILRLDCASGNVDIVPPVLSLPATIRKQAVGPDGAPVTFDVSAIDAVDGPVPVACDRDSGSVFSVGTTTVHCSASDAAGNAAAGSFDVVVTPPPDATAPTITAANLSKEATGPKTIVDYSFEATDPDDAVVSKSCEPAPGSLFEVGSTPIHCTATDSHGNTATQDFAVVVTDTTPPALTLPATITAEATSADGATVTFDVSAVDLVDGAVAATCSKASGATFPLGATTVECTATDAHHNTRAESFTVEVGDTLPPVLTLPPPINAAATSPEGAAVPFTASAIDAVDGPVEPACSPQSGSTFPLGATDVQCTATDAHHNSTSGHFTIFVEPAAAPVVTVPSPITVNATSPAGAFVTFTVTATDPVDGTLTPTCSKSSGSLFPIGDTSVSCTATNSSGLTSPPATFGVRVKGAAEQLADLHQTVLQRQLGVGTSISDKLRDALAAVTGRTTFEACVILDALDHQVRAQSGKRLTAADATWLRREIARIDAVLGC